MSAENDQFQRMRERERDKTIHQEIRTSSSSNQLIRVKIVSFARICQLQHSFFVLTVLIKDYSVWICFFLCTSILFPTISFVITITTLEIDSDIETDLNSKR